MVQGSLFSLSRVHSSSVRSDVNCQTDAGTWSRAGEGNKDTACGAMSTDPILQAALSSHSQKKPSLAAPWSSQWSRSTSSPGYSRCVCVFVCACLCFRMCVYAPLLSSFFLMVLLPLYFAQQSYNMLVYRVRVFMYLYVCICFPTPSVCVCYMCLFLSVCVCLYASSTSSLSCPLPSHFPPMSLQVTYTFHPRCICPSAYMHMSVHCCISNSILGPGEVTAGGLQSQLRVGFCSPWPQALIHTSRQDYTFLTHRDIQEHAHSCIPVQSFPSIVRKGITLCTWLSTIVPTVHRKDNGAVESAWTLKMTSTFSGNPVNIRYGHLQTSESHLYTSLGAQSLAKNQNLNPVHVRFITCRQVQTIYLE
jgi:hypothetical protein